MDSTGARWQHSNLVSLIVQDSHECTMHTHIFHYITLPLYKKNDACNTQEQKRNNTKTPRKYDTGVYAKSPVQLNNGSR